MTKPIASMSTWKSLVWIVGWSAAVIWLYTLPWASYEGLRDFFASATRPILWIAGCIACLPLVYSVAKTVQRLGTGRTDLITLQDGVLVYSGFLASSTPIADITTARAWAPLDLKVFARVVLHTTAGEKIMYIITAKEPADEIAARIRGLLAGASASA